MGTIGLQCSGDVRFVRALCGCWIPNVSKSRPAELQRLISIIPSERAERFNVLRLALYKEVVEECKISSLCRLTKAEFISEHPVTTTSMQAPEAYSFHKCTTLYSI